MPLLVCCRFLRNFRVKYWKNWNLFSFRFVACQQQQRHSCAAAITMWWVHIHRSQKRDRKIKGKSVWYKVLLHKTDLTNWCMAMWLLLRPRWFVGNQDKKKLMILCARSTSRSREQSTKRVSRSENMWKVCLFYSQNNKIVWLSNMADTFLEKFTRCAKVCGFPPLDYAFRTLIGRAGRLIKWMRHHTNLVKMHHYHLWVLH